MWSGEEQAKSVAASRLGGIDARPSIRQRLEAQKKELEFRLQQVTDALDVMDSQPEVAAAFEKLQRVL